MTTGPSTSEIQSWVRTSPEHAPFSPAHTRAHNSLLPRSSLFDPLSTSFLLPSFRLDQLPTTGYTTGNTAEKDVSYYVGSLHSRIIGSNTNQLTPNILYFRAQSCWDTLYHSSFVPTPPLPPPRFCRGVRKLEVWYGERSIAGGHCHRLVALPMSFSLIGQSGPKLTV